MTKVEFQKVKKGSWLENTSGIFEVSGISSDGLMKVKEVIFVDDNSDDIVYGIPSYITRYDVEQMELIAELTLKKPCGV